MALFSRMATAVFALASVSAMAADHRDGPLATGDPAADLNDVYTFVNPNDPDELIVILTMHPGASYATRFSDAVDYRFHIDNGTPSGTTLISCRFSDRGARVLCRGAGDTLYAEGRIEQLIDAGVDEVMCLIQMGTVPHEVAMETIRIWGDVVIPHAHATLG